MGSYNIKDLATALERIKAASVMFLTVPGPKMIWQFGELGYDQSINRCEDGTINEGCRVSPKPVHWDYRDDDLRFSLYSHMADLIRLRNTYDVFTVGTANVQSGTTFVRQISLKNSPFTDSPADASEMDVQIVVNFDAIAYTENVTFPHTGTWFECYSGRVISVTAATVSETLRPGECRMYTDIQLRDPVTGIAEEGETRFSVYPNLAEDAIYIDGSAALSVSLYAIDGRQVSLQKRHEGVLSLAAVPKGLYILKLRSTEGIQQVKIIKR